MRRRRSSAHRDSADRGSVAVIVAAAFVPLTMALAVVADGGRVWMEKQKLQNEVEASALAVAQAQALGGTSCSAAALALVDGTPTCSTSTTANGSVATVAANESVALTFAQLFGRDSAGIDASASVRIGPAAGVSGLRPVAMCIGNSALADWLASGRISTQTYTIGIESTSSECGSEVSGNWGVIDFDGGANSMSDAQDWIATGYDGTVSVGESLDGDPGIPSPALNLDELVGEIVTLPVFENPRLVGSNATYDIAGFVRVRIVEVNLSGSASNRNVKVTFEPGAVNGSVGGVDAPDFGVTAWSVCSFDGKGVCS
jgi:Flp pilus assembly protein TadG